MCTIESSNILKYNIDILRNYCEGEHLKLHKSVLYSVIDYKVLLNIPIEVKGWKYL